MLILYKPFKFSDLVYADNNIYVGRYSNSDLELKVIESRLPKLYNLYFVDTTLYKYVTETCYEKTEAEIEVIINQAIGKFRHVSTI